MCACFLYALAKSNYIEFDFGIFYRRLFLLLCVFWTHISQSRAILIPSRIDVSQYQSHAHSQSEIPISITPSPPHTHLHFCITHTAIAAAAAHRLGDSLVDSARALAATLHAENAAESQHREEKERLRAAMRVAVAQGEDLTEVCALYLICSLHSRVIIDLIISFVPERQACKTRNFVAMRIFPGNIVIVSRLLPCHLHSRLICFSANFLFCYFGCISSPPFL